MNRIVILVTLMIASIPCVFAKPAKCVTASGSSITLQGTVIKKQLPGPPNYQSISKGDRAETYWFLKLEKPVCFKPDGEFLSKPVVLKKVQLVSIKKRGYQGLLKNKRHSISGKTMAGHTGHHRTKVLLIIDTVK